MLRNNKLDTFASFRFTHEIQTFNSSFTNNLVTRLNVWLCYNTLIILPCRHHHTCLIWPFHFQFLIFSLSDMGSNLVDTQSSNAVNVFTQNICPSGSVYLRIIPLNSDSKFVCGISLVYSSSLLMF